MQQGPSATTSLWAGRRSFLLVRAAAVSSSPVGGNEKAQPKTLGSRDWLPQPILLDDEATRETVELD
jgi:hypothetical protein